MEDFSKSIIISSPIDKKIANFKKWKSEEPTIETYNSNSHRVMFRLSSNEIVITEKGLGISEDKSLYIPISELKNINAYLNKHFQVKE
ncbi:MAG: hypothetical protein WBA74_10375 [Cyclobacteriaceae bacterium]